MIFGVDVNCVDYDAKKHLFVVDAGTHGPLLHKAHRFRKRRAAKVRRRK